MMRNLVLKYLYVYICIYVHSTTDTILQFSNIDFRMPAVPVIILTEPPSDGQNDVEQRRQSFSMHGDRRDSRISRQMSVTGGGTPLIVREENEHSLSYVFSKMI